MGKARIEQNANEWNARHQVAQQTKPLRLHDICVQGIAGRVATGVVKALDQSLADRIAAYPEHDGNGRGGTLGRAGRGVAADRDEHAYSTTDEIGRYRGEQVVTTARPPELNREILTLDIAALGQTAAEGCQQVRRVLGRTRAHVAYHRHRRLLRARRDRPRHRRAAEERDELAPLHSITSSARTRNDSGILSPSAFALLRLTISSNLIGCSTGRSAGLAPLKILST